MENITLTVLIVVFSAINLLRMAFFLIASDVYGVVASRTKRLKKQKSTDLPSITVVIPAHNEEATVLDSVKSVVECEYPRNKKRILVVDDGSTDKTLRVVKKYIRENRLKKVRIVSQANSGKANALNFAIKRYVRSKIVMCLDADSRLEKKALLNTARHFADPKVATMSANVKIIERPGLLNWIQRYEYLVCYQMKRAESLVNCQYIVGGIGSAFRRSVLKKVGYYDVNTVTEDIDLTMKILRLGNKKYKAVYGADVVAYTEAVLDIKGLINQRFRWKWGRCQTFLKQVRMFFSPKKKYTKSLTWFYLPFAIYGDIAYLLEPIFLTYIVAISIYYQDIVTIASAWAVVTTYLSLNVFAEDTINFKEKIKLALGLPFLYFLFYILSFVEYVALIKSLLKINTLKQSLKEDKCHWTHVDRIRVKPSLAS